MLVFPLWILSGCGSGLPAGTRWVAAWGAAMQGTAAGQAGPLPGDRAINQTLRLIAPLTAGGDHVRIRLSNVYGLSGAQFQSVTVAVRSHGAALMPATVQPVTFQGSRSVTLAPGSEATSDPVALALGAGQDLAVSLYVRGSSPVATLHVSQPTTSYFTAPGAGDATGDTGGQRFGRASRLVPWLTAVDVLSHEERGAIVALGDSLTDGAGLPPDRDARWTDQLAARLRSLPSGRREAVVNEGIAGDSLTLAHSIPSGADRFARDVLGQSGANEVVLALGIEDVAAGVSAAAIEQAMLAIVRQSRKDGVRVYAATLVPAALAASERQVRLALNRWIRTSPSFDGVIDLDAALRDPLHRERLAPRYDSGDHVDPNAAGVRAIARVAAAALAGRG